MSLSFDKFLDRDFIKLPLDDADIYYCESFIDNKTSDQLFEHLEQHIDWQQASVKIFGQSHLTPRLSALYGDAGLSYRYSGYTEKAKLWLPELSDLCQKINHRFNTSFNSVLANLYRDGRDSNGWHADNEPELGRQPVIASLSFGAERDFQLKHRFTNSRHDFKLASGSLLLMAGNTQISYLHCLPKRKRCELPRINLTYRTIHSLDLS